MGCGDRPVGLGRAGMPARRGTKPLTGRERTGLQEERWRAPPSVPRLGRSGVWA